MGSWIYIEDSPSVSWVDEAWADLTWRSARNQRGHIESPGRAGTVELFCIDSNPTVGHTSTVLGLRRTSTIGKVNHREWETR